MKNKKTLDELILEVLNEPTKKEEKKEKKSLKDLDKLIESVILEHVNK